MSPYPMKPKPSKPAPRPKRTFCGMTVTAQFTRRPRVLRLMPSSARSGA